jgi:homoserine kinase
MGAGFGSIGMSIALYNELTLCESDRFSIEFKKKHDIDVPTTKENLIYKVIVDFYKKINKPLPTLRLIQEDDIPIARGLGSSAACIVAGLMTANELSGAGLSKNELLRIAGRMEGYIDNVAPAIMGGMVVGVMNEDKMDYVKIKPSSEISFIAFIPNFPIITEQTREILPKKLSLSDIVFNMSRANLFIASIMTSNWDNLQVATDDKIHQPYRKKLIPDMDTIFKKSLEKGAKGVYLSGAGSSIIAIVLEKHKNEFISQVKPWLKTLKDIWKIMELQPDSHGTQFI